MTKLTKLDFAQALYDVMFLIDNKQVVNKQAFITLIDKIDFYGGHVAGYILGQGVHSFEDIVEVAMGDELNSNPSVLADQVWDLLIKEKPDA